MARVILQKQRVNSPMNWRRTRNMSIQLLGMVIVFLFTQIPLMIFALIRLSFDPTFLTTLLSLWYYYTSYLIFLLIPFSYVITTIEVHKHLRVLKCCKSSQDSPFLLSSTGQILRNVDATT